MLEIRIHGRGGQGSVVAAKILAVAACREGLYVQAFPEFGVERRGAPVCAYLRISRKKIYERGQIKNPDHLLILDPTLLQWTDLTEGLKEGGWIVMNSSKEPVFYSNVFGNFKIATVDANAIALRYRLGSKFAPFVNTIMLGAFVKAVPVVSLDTVLRVIGETVPTRISENVQAAKEAHQSLNLADEAEEVWAIR